MQHKNVDKDPDLQKSSDLEQRDESSVPRLIAWGAVLALIATVSIVLVYFSPAWGPNQWGNVGTWVAGIATSLAVIVAVWQTNNANKTARRAEQGAQLDAARTEQRHRDQMVADRQRHQAEILRLQKESRERKNEEMRNREYIAVQGILNALYTLVAEVNNHARAIETSVSLTEILTDNMQMSESDKFKIELELINRSEASQMALLRTTNDCMVTVRTSMYQIDSPDLMDSVSSVFVAMNNVAKCFTTTQKENDWNEAVDKAEKANQAGIPLQKKAAYRFLRPDDEILN